jgi:hypothetical protein
MKATAGDRMREFVAVVALGFAVLALLIPRDARVAPLVVALGLRPSSKLSSVEKIQHITRSCQSQT